MKYWNICNECLEVWEDTPRRCPSCGSTDYDMDDDPHRFNGGLDADQ